MALSELSGLQSGRLTVGAIPTFLNTVVPVTVGAFSRAYPGVAIEVRELRAGPIEEQLRSGELDLGIAFHPTTHAEIETEPLFDERMLLVVAPIAPAGPAAQPGAEGAGRRAAGTAAAQLRHPAPRRRQPARGRRRGHGAHRDGFGGVAAGGVPHGDVASIVPERAALLAPDLHAMR
jgi:LysR family transcriptional regulator, cyn operon transcriptional activator